MGMYRTLSKEVLLLGGTKTPAYLREALAALEQTLPNARREALEGLDHSGSWNADRGGTPGLVAMALRRFFEPRPG